MRVLILLSFVALAFANQECGEFEEFNSCGTACPLTCDNYRNPPKACVLMCVNGCHCKEGYVRTPEGRCIDPKQCPIETEDRQMCGANAEYDSCGTACPLICENRHRPPVACILPCVRGCHCKEGFAKDYNGNCVKPEDCPTPLAEQKCGENAHYESCGTACPITCDNHNDPPQGCIMRCESGCQCDKGYVKHSDGRCVKAEQCSERTDVCAGENEHFESCGTPCPLTCDNYKNPPKFCVKRCDIGCHCDEGYVRHSDGRCVKSADCPAQAKQVCAGENEHFESCGTACPLTCENYDNPPRFCVKRCDIGCHCDEGYVRHSDGRCVKSEECHARAEQVCGENEKFESCGTACPLTCDNYQNPPKFCVLSCNIGCHCEKGHVRSSDGRCVKPEECPARAEQLCDDENEEFQSCGTACPLTCENYDNPPRSCIQRCNIGCHCKKGLVRNSDGKCVKPDQCLKPKAVCGVNQVYKECGTACPRTCDNINNPPEVCVAMCVSGCQCEEGYVQAKDGRCVRSEECPGSAQVDEAPRIFDGCLEEGQVTGPCRGYFPRWSFNKESGKCEQFIYGGCQGNKNNFGAEEDCNLYCGAKSAPTACLEEKVEGKCKAYLPRFYYNKATGKCESFIYGGCGGNSNNFMNKQDCHDVCGVVEEAPRNVGDCLEGEKVTGPCRAYIPSWSFNKLSGKCEQFVYGGCGGTNNNFESEEDCRNLCAAKAAPTACQLEKVVGPCKAAFPRFYFDSATGQCEEFIYGGCQGNFNNFLTKEDCHAVCTE